MTWGQFESVLRGKVGAEVATHYHGTAEEERALDTYVKLMRAATSVQSLLDKRLTTLGLTENQFGVLETLWHLGPMHQRVLGEKLLTTRPNITAILDNLEKRGLAARVRDTDDRRHITVHLTETGEALIADIFPDHVAAIVEIFSAVEPEAQRDLADTCKRLGLSAQARQRER